MGALPEAPTRMSALRAWKPAPRGLWPLGTEKSRLPGAQIGYDRSHSRRRQTPMKRALVTGANGFIGSHLVRHLLGRGYDVSCLVRQTSDIRSLAGLPVRIHIGDVRQPETLMAPLGGAEFVFHLAAELMALEKEAFAATNTQGGRKSGGFG